MATQREIANHLDMSERNARDVLKALGVDGGVNSLDEIRVAYIRDLRDKAAGRGGDLQSSLAAARAEEATTKAAVLRLQYQEKLGSLIQVTDVRLVLERWATFANRELRALVQKISSDIQAENSIEIDSEKISPAVDAACNRIAEYASVLGQQLCGEENTSGNAK